MIIFLWLFGFLEVSIVYFNSTIKYRLIFAETWIYIMTLLWR